ncbi:uncharacterized protein LOC144247139 [Lonchura striata]
MPPAAARCPPALRRRPGSERRDAGRHGTARHGAARHGAGWHGTAEIPAGPPQFSRDGESELSLDATPEFSSTIRDFRSSGFGLFSLGMPMESISAPCGQEPALHQDTPDSWHQGDTTRA